MTDETTTCVALLHDVVEDTDMTFEDLARDFPPEVVEAVRLLTHAKDVDYFDYVRAIRGNPPTPPVPPSPPAPPNPAPPALPNTPRPVPSSSINSARGKLGPQRRKGSANSFGLHRSLCGFAADRARRPPFRAWSISREVYPRCPAGAFKSLVSVLRGGVNRP